MDGFYVCKIQKLSDKIKGENEPLEIDGSNEENAENEDKVEGGVVGKKKQKSKETGIIKKGGKKRSSKEEEMPKKKSKTEKLSIPPPNGKKAKTMMTKKKISAKMTRPRRLKAEKMM